MSYIPLNVKTSYSLLSSLNDIKRLINRCHELNIDTVAITDSNMFGVLDFYNQCLKNDIKPIIGLEIEIEEQKIFLYALDYTGYQNLTRLVFLKQNKKIDFDILNNHSNAILCIVPFLAHHYFFELKKIYKHIYLSYQSLDERKELINLSSKTIFMNEVLYLKKEDQIYLKYLYLIRDGKKKDEIDSYQVRDDHYLMTEAEVLECSIKKDFKNMLEIKELCNINFSLNKALMPKYSNESNFDAPKYLKALCKKGLEKRLNNFISDDYINRLKKELDIINQMGYDNYFLVVWDFIKYAKKNNILVGPGRGSAAGSLVSYCLGITDIDPLKYDLLFERFLNPERITMPDIDIDFESTRRGEVVNYVINKYGYKKAMPIITYVTLGGRQVIRDVGRIFDLETKLLDQICKLIDPHLSLVDNYKNNNLQQFLKNNNQAFNLYQIGLKLEGVKRQISIHAAGIVISDVELDSYIPLQKYDAYYITGFSMGYLEELGLLKMDFLGLKNLTLIKNVLNDINNDRKESLSFNNIPLDDKKALSLFEQGLTDGIFQFESEGMKNFIKKLKPNVFEEIIAAVALYRPGPMDNIGSYVKRKFGREKIDYIHPSLTKILKPTYGIIIYQEQIMQIANIMANYSLGEADVLRRAMSKKKKELLEKEQEKFVSRSIENGYSKEISLKVYNLILKFANYGFPRAHSVAYAMIAYKMAYIKVHYPTYFMSGLLTNVIGNETKTSSYINECLANDIKVLSPDINDSNYRYKPVKEGIRFSLAAIRNVGSITCQEIVNERNNNGVYIDFFDFVRRNYGRAVNSKATLSLIDAGCFDVFGYNHQTLYKNIDNALNYADLTKNIDPSLIEKPIMEEVPEFSNDELKQKERAVLGTYLKYHPVLKYNNIYHDTVPINQIINYFDKIVKMVVLVQNIKEITTKNNEKMAFILGNDQYGNVDITIFPKEYNLYNGINKGDVLLVTGHVEKRLSKYQLVLIKVDILS